MSAAALSAIERLWRHGVAASRAARRLAAEAGHIDPDRVAALSLVHQLGAWALAAVDGDRLARWMAISDRQERRSWERRWLDGEELATLGRTLAERWSAAPGLADAVWLHADWGLTLVDGESEATAAEVAIVQRAYAWAERSPWSLFEPSRLHSRPSEPWSKIVAAETQARTTEPFIPDDFRIHEDRILRGLFRMSQNLAQTRRAYDEDHCLAQAVAKHDPLEPLTSWAAQAAAAWAERPGVARARIAVETGGAEIRAAVGGGEDAGLDPTTRTADWSDRGRRLARLELTMSGESCEDENTIDPRAAAEPWAKWAALAIDRHKLNRRLETALRALRDRVEARMATAPGVSGGLDSLGEFSAGAGHELNNPFAVILGRAQLLRRVHRDRDSETSLSAIVTQVQRAHRIIRDLMYVARPPLLRPRRCRPDEILRDAVRDLEPEAERRGLGLSARVETASTRMWADPDALKHLADLFLRNAFEAVETGGMVQVQGSSDADRVRWVFSDDGHGIALGDWPKLIDPFYCGRDAGRGLGLGLPRAARIVAQTGGEWRWSSIPGGGTRVQIEMPAMPATEGEPALPS